MKRITLEWLIAMAMFFLLAFIASKTLASTPPNCAGNGGGMRIYFADAQGQSINQITEGQPYRVVVELFTFPHYPPEPEICRNFGGELYIDFMASQRMILPSPPMYGDGLFIFGHGLTVKETSQPIIADKHDAIGGLLIVTAHHDWICVDGIVTICSSFRSDSDWLRMVPACAGDVDDSRTVDAADLEIVLTHWGSVTPAPDPADVNHDGMVGIDDLLLLLAYWGGCPP